MLNSRGIVYIDPLRDGNIEPAWTCSCGENKDGPTYIVELEKPEKNVKYIVAHEVCVRVP